MAYKLTLNTKDARFQRHEQLINVAFHGMLTKRSRNIRPGEICRQAKVSRTTFYAHYDNADFVGQYEQKLKANFCMRLPKAKTHKEVVYLLLLKFVRENFGYFVATVPNANFWLLKAIYAELKPIVAHGVTPKSYDFYVLQQMALIARWVEYEKCAPDRMDAYAKKMAYMNVMKVEV